MAAGAETSNKSLDTSLRTLLSHLVGHKVCISFKSGEKDLTGLVSYKNLVSPQENSLKLELAQDETGKMYFNPLDIPIEKIESITGKAILSVKSSSAGFKTDSGISAKGSVQISNNRELERWQVEPNDSANYSLLISSTNSNSSINEKWNQFQANQKLFGIQTSFDETQYTTVINKDDPEYEKRRQQAENIAREIESQTTLNSNESARISEERGQEGGDESSASDEEALFSQVKGSTSSSKLNVAAAEYVPQAISENLTKTRYQPSYNPFYPFFSPNGSQFTGTVYYNTTTPGFMPYANYNYQHYASPSPSVTNNPSNYYYYYDDESVEDPEPNFYYSNSKS